MDGKVLSKETKKFLVGVIDDLIKAPWWGEAADGPAISLALNWLDKAGDKIIPDNFDAAINEIANLAANGQWEEAASKAGEIMDALIDIPVIPDELEKAIFIDGVKLLVRAIQLWISKKK